MRKNSRPKYDLPEIVLNRRLKALALILSLSALNATTASAAESVTLLNDLTSTLAVLNLPCDKVVSAAPQAANDHIATCKDGNRYRIFVNPQGRVVATKL